jgi:hypothetical protein
MTLVKSRASRAALAFCLVGALGCVGGPGDEELAGSQAELGKACLPATPATPPSRGCGSFDYADVTASINGDTILGSTAGAPDTINAGCAFNESGDVTYMITPDANGEIRLATGHPGTTFDTVVSVRDLCAGGELVACNDDCAFGDLSSCPTFLGRANTSYLIVVTGFASNEGEFELSITQEGARRGAIPASPATPSGHAIPGGPGHPAIPPSACEHHLCDRGGPLAACCSWCVAAVCAADPFCCNNAWDGLCVREVETVCGLADACPDSCGDGTCDFFETCSSCAADCGACPPPSVCGDSFCDFDEFCGNCAADCGACPPPPGCGDGTCDLFEDCASCPDDCACP